MLKQKTTIKEKPIVLIIANEDQQTPFYAETVTSLGYEVITAFGEWYGNPELRRDERVRGHCGPLCNGFIEALFEKNTEKYDAVVVDLFSDDLVATLRHAGYQRPVVIIGDPMDERYPLPYVPFGTGFVERLQGTLRDVLQ